MPSIGASTVRFKNLPIMSAYSSSMRWFEEPPLGLYRKYRTPRRSVEYAPSYVRGSKKSLRVQLPSASAGARRSSPRASASPSASSRSSGASSSSSTRGAPSRRVSSTSTAASDTEGAVDERDPGDPDQASVASEADPPASLSTPAASRSPA